MADVTLDLPALEVGWGLPAVAATGDVVLGLPVLEWNLTAPAPFIGTADPADSVIASVYGIDGTFIARLPNVRNVKWQEQLSAPGAASFDVPLDDATTAQILNRRIVKLVWLHGGRVRAQFACRINSETTQIAVDGNRWVQFQDQPGCMCMVGDAVVYPEYASEFGLDSTYSSSRTYGYMSSGTFWQVPGAWVTPQGTRWDAPGPGNAHSKTPPEFSVDPSAEWISRTSPNVTQPYRVAQYFRATFTLAEQTDIQVLASGDNYMDLYVDGEQLFTADYAHMNSWWSAQEATTRLPAGTHIIAVRVENGPKTRVRNPVAFICTVRSLDSKGNPDGVVLHTNTSDWVCADDTPDPGWTRAQVLRSAFLEAKDRGVQGVTHCGMGFTYDRDSAGQPWTDRGNYVVDVGTVSLVDVITQLTEADMDVTFNHAALSLLAWRRAGRDRSGSVALTWGEPSGSFKSYQVDTTRTRFNVVLTQLSSGAWIETESSSSIGIIGRIEAGLSLGSAVTDPSAAGVAGQQIAESAQPVVSLTSQTSLLTGAQPYVDYFLGDSITVPNQRDTGTMKARVMAITVDATGETLQAYPELVQDLS